MLDYNTIFQTIISTAKNLASGYASNGTMTVDEANTVFQSFQQYNAQTLATKVYNVAFNSGGQIDNIQLQNAIVKELATLLQTLRQQRMGYGGGMMQQQAPLVQMGVPAQQYQYNQPQQMLQPPFNNSMPAHSGPSVSTMADIYGYGNNNRGIPSNQQTPQPVVQPRQELRGQVSGRIEYENPANTVNRSVSNTTLNEVSTMARIINNMKDNDEGGIDTSTITVNIINNVEAMKIVENMDDLEADFKIHNVSKLSTDTIVADNVVMTLKSPFTNHTDPRTLALQVLKSVPVFSSNPYYAHVLKYYTLHDIYKPFHVIRARLDDLLKFKESEPNAMKWNNFIGILGSQVEFVDLRTRFNQYLANVSKCMFNYSTQDGGSNTLIADDISDIPNILNVDGEYRRFVSNDRLMSEAHIKFRHVYDYLIPNKFYLDPNDPNDQKILVNRPDSGIIHNGRFLRYSDELYTEVTEGAGDDTVVYEAYSKDVISKISNVTTIMQKHIVLLTNIPFANSTLSSIAYGPKHRAIIPKPSNILECTLEKVHSPIHIDNGSGINYIAGRNLDTNLTVFTI